MKNGLMPMRLVINQTSSSDDISLSTLMPPSPAKGRDTAGTEHVNNWINEKWINAYAIGHKPNEL
jgi:hypothetical protein